MKDKRFWTPDEDDKLRNLAKDGKSALEISADIERSVSSVRKRAGRLSIVLARSPPGPLK